MTIYLLEFYSFYCFFFFSSRRRHTRLQGDWSSDVCSSDLHAHLRQMPPLARQRGAALRGHHIGVDLLVDPMQIDQDAAVDHQHAHQQSQHQGPQLLGDRDLIQIHGKTDLFYKNAGARPWRPCRPSLRKPFLSTLDGAWLIIVRSEEHTSELQSPCNLVCRLLLEKKKLTI